MEWLQCSNTPAHDEKQFMIKQAVDDGHDDDDDDDDVDDDEDTQVVAQGDRRDALRCSSSFPGFAFASDKHKLLSILNLQT